MTRLIDFIEWSAGKLIVIAARLRMRRGGGYDDAHEVRHLLSALAHGNSSDCEPGSCALDLQAIHDYLDYIDPPLVSGSPGEDR